MKKNAVALPFAVGAFLLFAGCGDDVTKTTVNETGISQLAAGDEFPKCTEDESGEMLYAADSGKAYICTGKAWTPLHGESSADTVVVRDTLVQKDSVFFSQVDTLVIRDTLLGLNGESCSAEILEDGTGYKIVCGNDSVGVVLNGIDGEKGDDGESCTVADSGNGVVAVQCESDTVKLYKALCGTTPYDPAKSFCYNGGAKDTIVTLCGGKTYDLGESFCYNGGSTNDTIVTLCGGNDYDLSASFCYNNGMKDSVVTLCGGNEYNVTDSICYKGVTVSRVVAVYFNPELLAAETYGTFTDSRDGQVYLTIAIGSQTWMAQNLNYRYTQGTSTLDSSSFCYDGNASNCTKYGRLYTWSAAMDSAAVFSVNGSDCGYKTTCSATEPVRGVCPEGWHLPTEAEWEALFTTVGGKSSAGTKLKATSGWNNNGNGTDDYGFSALAGGRRYASGTIDHGGYNAYFWNSKEEDAGSVCNIYLRSDNDGVTLDYNYKINAFSVRCVKD